MFLFGLLVVFNKKFQFLQELNYNAFHRLLLSSAQCIFRTKKNPDTDIHTNYLDDDHSQGYSQLKKAASCPREDYILQPYTSDDDFRSSNDDNDIGYNVNVFDIRF